MITEIIGNKELFAVEFSIEKKVSGLSYGLCLIWIAGEFIGNPDDRVYLSRVRTNLIAIKENFAHADSIPAVPNSPADLLAMATGEGLENSGKHFFFDTDGFDNFVKLFFQQGDTTTFYWCLHPALANVPKYSSYSHKVHSAKIPTSAINSVVDEFCSRIES
ncbi:hypothetical protein [Burkholderia anthina]|uniref:hypothetical protein n=1 Tax=Burkholderia anthina TaxID=179879 RepID=UPI0037BF62EC